MATRFVVGVAAMLFMAACVLPGSNATCTASIDWVNFIMVGSTQYLAGGPAAPIALQESDLGPVYAHVKFKVSGNVCDPAYRLKDGDAAFLDPGTAIYQVNGYAPGDRLAARFNRALLAYQAMAPAT